MSSDPDTGRCLSCDVELPAAALFCAKCRADGRGADRERVTEAGAACEGCGASRSHDGGELLTNAAREFTLCMRCLAARLAKRIREAALGTERDPSLGNVLERLGGPWLHTLATGTDDGTVVVLVRQSDLERAEHCMRALTWIENHAKGGITLVAKALSMTGEAS